jgi:hypothetical protein
MGLLDEHANDGRGSSAGWFCPEHGATMQRCQTKYGGRWACTVALCTVVCWEGQTSTPADAETRALRRQCHEAFDPLWKPGAQRRFRHRGHAYIWLSRLMGTVIEETHIGMFNAEQCRSLLEKLTTRQGRV